MFGRTTRFTYGVVAQLQLGHTHLTGHCFL